MSPRTATVRTAPRTARTAWGRAAAQRPSTAARPRVTDSGATSRPQLRVIESVPGRRAGTRSGGERRAPFVLLVVALLVGTTLVSLVLTTAINVNSLKASTLRSQNAELAQDVQRLQKEVVDGATPAALAAAATAAGLVPAGSAAYLVIAPDGSSTLRGEVTPAPEPPKPHRPPADKD